MLLDHLLRLVEASERIDVLVPARLVDVLVDDDRRVRAAVVEMPDGTREEVPTPAVLLATNGYGADREAVAEHLPEIADAVYHGSDASTGDALRIGRALGAATAYLDAYQGHGALAAGSATLVGWATVMHGGGRPQHRGPPLRRRDDRLLGVRRRRSPGSPVRPGGSCSTAASTTPAWRSPTSGRPSSPACWSGPTRPAELAQATGLPVDGRGGASSPSTAAVARGEGEDRFGRQAFEDELRPPYAAVRVVPALFHTQGGLVVDEHARVVREDGSVVEGLYASGGAAAGISGHGAAGYLAGNGLLPALGLAYLAADHAAQLSHDTRHPHHTSEAHR